MKTILQNQKHVFKRLIVAGIALYPTLLIILYSLNSMTRTLSMPVATFIEVIVIVPVTQLISFPLAGKIFAKWLAA